MEDQGRKLKDILNSKDSFKQAYLVRRRGRERESGREKDSGRERERGRGVEGEGSGRERDSGRERGSGVKKEGANSVSCIYVPAPMTVHLTNLQCL